MSLPSNEVMLRDPIIPVDQSVYEFSTSQKAPLGTRLKLADRTFYYAQASASVAGGAVMCAPGPTASHQSGIFTIAATSAGALRISGTSSASLAANYYAEGYFGEALGAGAGQLYKVKGHPAGTAAINIDLYDGLATTVTSGAGFWLYPNPYKLCNVGSAALGMPVGVAPCDVTSGSYFWLQSYGPANPKHVGASVAAGALTLGTTGSVNNFVTTGTLGSTGNAPIDYAFIIGKNSPLAATAGEANPVFLTVRP